MVTENKEFIDIENILAKSNINLNDCMKITESIIKLSYENKDLKGINASLDKRLRHLLSSKIISMFDEIDPKTKKYKYDISKFDSSYPLIFCGRQNGKMNIINKYKEVFNGLLSENQELKKQLEEIGYTVIPNCEIKKVIDKYKNQQKEFIEYLEDEIKMEEETFKKYGYGNINGYYAAANKVTLEKYKEIIGEKNDR